MSQKRHYQVGVTKSTKDDSGVLALLEEASNGILKGGKYSGIIFGARYFDYLLDEQEILVLEQCLKCGLSALKKSGVIEDWFYGANLAPVAS